MYRLGSSLVSHIINNSHIASAEMYHALATPYSRLILILLLGVLGSSAAHEDTCASGSCGGGLALMHQRYNTRTEEARWLYLRCNVK